jgi:hypothetical protein
MEKRDKEPSEQQRGYPNFKRAAISGLKKSRKGKHHGLMLKVIEDLRHSEPGFAVEIPLAETGGTEVLNLRSAILRASAKEGFEVNTSSDDKNFYVWKAKNGIKKKA